MVLTLKRKIFNKASTEGNLFINGKWFCHVIEDATRAEPGAWAPYLKIYGKTAIPYGIYPVLATWSTRFKRILTGVFAVPDYEGIRIHNGHNELSSAGCLIVSYKAGSGFVVNDKAAMNDLCKLIEKTQKNEKIVIEIVKDKNAVVSGV